MKMEALRKGLLGRATGLLTLFFFCFVFYLAPIGDAIADSGAPEDRSVSRLEASLADKPDELLGHRLSQLREKLTDELPRAIEHRRTQQSWFECIRERIAPSDALTGPEINELRRLGEAIDAAYRDVIEQREQRERRWQDIEVEPKVRQLIQERQEAARNRLETRHTATMDHLRELLEARGVKQRAALDALKSRMEKESFERRHTPLDPDRLPWGIPSEKVREPVTDPEDFKDILGATEPDNPLLASAELFSGILAQGSPENNLSRAADLAETLEVQFTDDILERAEALNNDPIEIYTWVRNNIHFIPSYGSIQGAQHTLETRSGNATDTASLLISLLRAAGTPARYAYGTVDVPVDKAMNWVGGVETPAAAARLLSQGGIPTTSIINQEEEVTHIRIEHVWVQAWVDYFPSRGMKHQEGDSWIPLDASFKQYEYTEGMDLQENVPFDAESLIALIEGTAIINEEEGWIQNIPADDMNQQLDLYQQQVEDYINQQNPEATLGDVLGMQDIKVIVPRPLAAGLPYRHIATAESFSEVPDSLRHRFKYELATLFQGIPLDTIIAIDEPTASLAGKTLALSFRPATEEDEAIIMAYLPQPDPETGEIDPGMLPESLPGGLINMTAEFTIDGVVVAESDAGGMGAQLQETMALWHSGHERWADCTNSPVAGEYRAIGLDLQGASPDQAARLQENIERTREALESMDETRLASLTRHDVVGDLFYATIFSYFALNSVQDQIAARGSGIVTYRAPSYGLFGTRLQTSYLYDEPQEVRFGTLVMDVDNISRQVVSVTNDDEQRTAFMQATGARYSAMEHLVPEMMFSTEESPGHGISTVKALALAAEEGQRIWTITTDNLDLALENIDLSANAKTDIRNAVNEGKVVTAHESPLNFHGWVGSGYIVMDPETGAGGYLIGGGMNGGYFVWNYVKEVVWPSIRDNVRDAWRYMSEGYPGLGGGPIPQHRIDRISDYVTHNVEIYADAVISGPVYAGRPGDIIINIFRRDYQRVLDAIKDLWRNSDENSLDDNDS